MRVDPISCRICANPERLNRSVSFQFCDVFQEHKIYSLEMEIQFPRPGKMQNEMHAAQGKKRHQVACDGPSETSAIDVMYFLPFFWHNTSYFSIISCGFWKFSVTHNVNRNVWISAAEMLRKFFF